MQSVLRAQQLSRQGFAHGFSTRQGGVSAAPYASLNLGGSVGDDAAKVAENLRRFAGWVGYEPSRLFTLSQVHGARVRTLSAGDEPEAVRGEQADALVARERAPIAIRTADCVPLLLADPVTRCVAAVHAGWRGTVAGVVPAGVAALLAACHAPPERLLAAVFPHIRACCFEVGADVAAQLNAVAHGADAIRPGPKPHVDLAAIVRAQLMAAGLVAQNVEDVPGCTVCDPERFYSFRRDAAASGRHLAAIVAGGREPRSFAELVPRPPL